VVTRASVVTLAAGLTIVCARFQAGSLLAQSTVAPELASAVDGHVALGLALRKLNVSGTLMQIAAHPDDEHNGLLAEASRRMGLRAISVQTTRGGGGQNEIGPELFQDLAVLRTSELLTAHRLDGAEQYFTRAIDYGYSFDPQEVIDKWGREAIVGDFVRLIRMLRPDVVLTMNIQGQGGDRAHEATTILSRDAYLAAGDPAKYPEQLAVTRPAAAGRVPRRRSAQRQGRSGSHGSIRRPSIRCSAGPMPRSDLPRARPTSARG
jgi:LmbE family N-acetylglucosaminyl deacetylase